MCPAHALADEHDLRVRLDRHLRLDLLDDADDLGAGQVRERRAAVAEDPRIAVLVGTDPPREPEVGQGSADHVLGARVAGVFEVVLDAIERGARLGMLDLEAWDDERARAVHAEDAGDRPLGRNEREARVVENVGRVEEHDPGETSLACSLEEDVAARAMLVRRDGDRREHRGGAYGSGLDPTAHGATFSA